MNFDNEGFFLDEGKVKKVLSLLHQPKFELELDPDHAVQKLDEHFVCTICMMVCIEPISCNKCDKMHCKKCITLHQDNDSLCPHCRQPFEAKAVHMSSFELRVLGSVEFRCKKCPETFTYANAMSHVQKHYVIRYNCPYACGS